MKNHLKTPVFTNIRHKIYRIPCDSNGQTKKGTSFRMSLFGLSLRNHYLRKALRRNGFRRSAQLFKPIQRQIGCPPNHAQAIFVLELPDGWVVKLSEQSWMMAVLQSPHGQKIEKRIPASEQRRQISDVVWVRTVIRIVMGHRQIAAFSP